MIRLRRFNLVFVLGATLGLGGCLGDLFSSPPQLFDLSPKNTFDENIPRADWQLVVEEPAAPTAINTDRMAIRPSSLQMEYIPDVKWTDRAPALVQTLMVESFENSGKIVGVGRRAIGLTGDYVLSSELREFEAVSDGAGGATVIVRLVLKLVRQSSGGIIASTTAEQSVESASDKPADLVLAFDAALGKVLKRTVQWVLTEGVADRKRYVEE
ncbi:MAG: membrane integrity-associated transporter subunit PqiC [Alphaproteobacteria bacterium]|nr:membrane integrity-associated transporter subunit PqiC [Alphaproteobacteria bacterium]